MKANIVLLSFSLYLIIVLNNVPAKADTGGPQRIRPESEIPTNFVFFDANRIGAWISNEGEFTSYIAAGGSSGMFWPRGTTKTINFQSGIWIAGLVDGLARTAAAEFTSEFRGGTYESFPDNPDSNRYRIYTIDALSGPGDEDWDNWPAADGAPVDSNGDPLLLGDKMYWSVFHDADSSAHESLFGTEPLGIEVRMTTWGYDSTGILGDVMFLNFQIFNKGTNLIEDAFVNIWADTDLGTANDDLNGTDTLLQMIYVYNAGPDAVYGDSTPAFGIGLLQGVTVPSPGDTAISFGKIIHDYANSALSATISYTGASGPATGDPENAAQAYYYMQGLNGLGEVKLNDLGEPTRFSFTGDPVSGEGWLRTSEDDVRGMISNGPFDLAPGDSNEFTAAVVIGQGGNNLESITELRRAVAQVRADRGLQLITSIHISPEKIQYPKTWIGYPQTRQVYLYNLTETDLLVSGISTSTAAFSPVSSELSIAPFTIKGVTVSFDPDTVGVYSDTLTFSTDNPEKPFVKIGLSGRSLLPPILLLSSDSIEIVLPVGVARGGVKLKIQNDGGDTLIFDICEVNCKSGDHIWLTIAPQSGEIFPADTLEIELLVTSTEMEPITLLGSLILRSNDPVIGEIPMLLKVEVKDGIEFDVTPFYVRPGIDSVRVLIDVSVLGELTGNPIAEISIVDSVVAESLELFDDGLHSDILAGDSIYGNTWIPSLEEEHRFTVDFLWQSTEGFSGFLKDLGEFTTLGPVVFDTLVSFDEDTVLNPGELYRFTYALKNKGNYTAIPNVSAHISSSSDCIELIRHSESAFGKIAPGESVFSQAQVIETSDNCDTLQDIKFDIDISSDKVSIWSDSFSIELTPVGVGDEAASIPDEYSLSQSFPNPFNAIATIHYALPKSSDVSLVIYNLQGQKIMLWDEQDVQPGYHEKTWNGKDEFGIPVASGVYFYRLTAGDFVQTRKMVLLK